MTLLNRLRKKLGRGRAGRRAVDAAWNEGEAYAKESFQRVAASLVASWEVAAAALYRKARESTSKDDAGALVNRFSDGLVPTMDGLSAVEHQLPGVWRTVANKPLDDRLRAVRDQLGPLPSATASGWIKTTAYVEQAFTTLDANAVDHLQLGPVGDRIADILRDEIERLLLDLTAFPRSPKPEQAIINAFLRFGDAACRGIEVELDTVRSVIQSLNTSS